MRKPNNGWNPRGKSLVACAEERSSPRATCGSRSPETTWRPYLHGTVLSRLPWSKITAERLFQGRRKKLTVGRTCGQSSECQKHVKKMSGLRKDERVRPPGAPLGESG